MWLRAIPGALKLVPREVWYALALALAVALARGWYNGKIHDAEKRGYAAAVEAGRKIAKQTDVKTITITNEIRSRTDEESGRINARADDQRLQGPGAARCPSVPSPAREHEPASGNADATRPDVSAEDRAAVPWEWLVGRAQQCDLNLNEVKAWREWHQRVLEAWPTK